MMRSGNGDRNSPNGRRRLIGRWGILGLLFLIVVATASPMAALAPTSAPHVEDPITAPPADGQGVQYTAAGHVLAFGPDGVIVAAGDHALKLEFVGANPREPQSSIAPSTDGRAQPLGVVTYPDLWGGVSLIWEATSNGVVKTSYEVAAGADPAAIYLRYNVPVSIDDDGDLVFAFATGTLRERAPVAWQEIDGQRVPVEVAFRVLDAREVKFTVGDHAPDRPLTIDPTLQWNTFLGGGEEDHGSGIAVDASGNITVVGLSWSTWGTPIRSYTGSADAFVARLDTAGQLVWNTFLGGSGFDCSMGVAVDINGSLTIVGHSYATWGSPLCAHAGSCDMFAARLNAGGDLVWSTFLGGSDFDSGGGVAVDGGGDTVVIGSSEATWGGPINSHAGSRDAFVAKLNALGALQWSTFLGGSGYDQGNGVVVDGNGNITVIGRSEATWGTPILAYAGDGDAFIAKLNTIGELQWNTFLGSANEDQGQSVAVDESGAATAVGTSHVTWGSPVLAYGGGYSDAFVARLDADGGLIWNTFLGGTSSDDGNGVAVASSGDIIVVGDSSATWGSPMSAHSGSSDAFVARLGAASGTLQWNTFLGGSGSDQGERVAADGSGGNIAVVGDSFATWGNPIRPFLGGSMLPIDVFVARLMELPEMGVQGNGRTIEDGDMTPTTQDDTDFSDVIAGATDDRTFTICNSGTAELALTGSPCVQITGEHAADFTVTVQPSTPIACDGGTCTFTVRFAPSALGLRTATISVANDDSDENPYDFAICGTGLEPGTDTAARFRVDATGRVLVDGTFTAAAFESPEADVAEWVTVSEPVEAGDVLELDPTESATYRLSRTARSTLVAGVVSTKPGVVLGEVAALGQRALLALTGIVPVKVTDEGGPIHPGDLLVSSSTPGHAMRWDGTGSPALIGKALEPMTDETGVILVLLTAH